MFTWHIHWFLSEIKAGHWFISWYIFTDIISWYIFTDIISWYIFTDIISDYFTDSGLERRYLKIAKGVLNFLNFFFNIIQLNCIFIKCILKLLNCNRIFRKFIIKLRNCPVGSKEIEIQSLLIAFYLLIRKRWRKCIPAYPTSIHLYLFLSFVYSHLPLRQSKFTLISFKLIFFFSDFPLFIGLYLFLSLVYPTLYLYISFQSRFTPTSFNPILFTSVYPSSILFYLFLSLVYPP